MIKRLLVAGLILFLPLAAAADDTASSAGLGPDTSSSAGSSNADAGTLQPAGLSPVQAAAPDSAGLGASASPLQAPAASDQQLNVLSGEADGSPHALDGQPAAPWLWIILGLMVVLAAGTVIVVRDRRRFRELEI